MPPPLRSLTADQVLALPVDDLAGIVLADLARRDEWAVRTYVNQATLDLDGDDQVRRALQEAVSWLLAKGLLSHDWVSRVEDAVFLTRAGEAHLAQQG